MSDNGAVPNAASPTLTYAVTDSMTARLLVGRQLGWMRRRGFVVSVVCSPSDELERVCAQEEVASWPVPMAREIAPLADLVSLLRLWWRFRFERPTIVNAGTPKAGLLGTTAAWLAGVPVRVYTVRGLRLETTEGAKRWLLTTTERLAAWCADRVVCVSPSLAQRYIELGLADSNKVRVLGAGSSNGVEAERFAEVDSAAVADLGTRLGIEPHRPVVGFVGRLTRDKGLEELVGAFSELLLRHPSAVLLLVGGYEAGDPLPKGFMEYIASHEAIVETGFVADTAPYYQLMQVLAFPSHREGFPNAPLEAAAAGLPTVGYAVTGTVDAVVDGVTGRVVPRGSTAELVEALDGYLEDEGLRLAHGIAAQRRAKEDFAPEQVWEALSSEYRQLLRLSSRSSRGYRFVKRLLDLVLSGVLLLVSMPVLVVVAGLVRLRLGSPVLFRQRRVGRREGVFEILKFRTMLDERTSAGDLLPDERRLTAMGRVLRATSLDELPELWNVLRGEMSLVGPRPLLPEYLEYYDEEQSRRHAVRPGITGWAQINGRNAATWEERFEMDVWYVDHQSLWLDLKILWRTPWTVLLRRGISADGHATMPRFRGNQNSRGTDAPGGVD